MPTYDYQCRSCGVITEVVHSMLEDGPATCDRCGGELRRLVSPSGIIFKGSGFYKTDSRPSSSGSVAGSMQPSPTAAGDGAAAPAPAESGSKAKNNTPTTPSGGSAGGGESGRSSGSGAAGTD